MKLMKSIYVLLIAAVFTSCQSDLLDTNPYGDVNSDLMWSTESLADQGVMGIYNILRQDRVGVGIYKYDAYGVSADNRDQEDYIGGKAMASQSLFSDYWKQHYEGIHRANDAIKNLAEKAPLSEAKKGRLIAESKFLRAFFYYKMNMVFRGVPLYIDPIYEANEADHPRESEAKIWEMIISDLTDCINETNLPANYTAGDANFGRATKAAAYSLRGKVYLWTQEWEKAEADFRKVGESGAGLFTGNYKDMFKESNEQSEEAIFSVQCIGIDGFGNDISFRYGSRVAFGSCWNTYLVNTDFVESYENKDGSKFDWDDYIPGYNSMTPDKRAVFFLRDNLTEDEKATMASQGADMSQYLPTGNEARILKAYENRDPRLTASIITPYSTYDGSANSVDYTYTLRWPYRGSDDKDPFDLRTDTNTRFYYLFRKFVAEGSSEIPNRSYSPIDVPLIRYADVLLGLAEALNEQGKTAEAVQFINKVRDRAGVAALNSNTNTTVSGQTDLRERIRNERRWEFAGEGINFFDELRWKTLSSTKFGANAGLKQIWGQTQYNNNWAGDYMYLWPIPSKEREMNSSLTQNDGWID